MYPDARALIAAWETEKGKVCNRGYFIAKVPTVPVFVLYGIDMPDGDHGTVHLIRIRTRIEDQN